MSESLALTLISSATTIIVAIIGVISAFNKLKVEMAKQEQRQNDRLDVIEKKIDEHNNYGRKFESCDKNIALLRKDIEYIKEAHCSKKKK